MKVIRKYKVYYLETTPDGGYSRRDVEFHSLRAAAEFINEMIFTPNRSFERIIAIEVKALTDQEKEVLTYLTDGRYEAQQRS